ncbi:acyltransferase [Sphingobacterium sp. InxBP1]|uniref:acyltransferase family protein n=1 Tax=Sphingobacterium sp. InxBP1 TaxID=2870328 RepID=UPI002244E3BE|nr:acyltransferase [Sphingobacterium sp. InxBP1]MCW8309656.1 acyltransferase [Sphingobacterium sp. InxBP1]
MRRIFTLDYLRGIAALLILVYHYSGWQGWEFDAQSPIQRVGYYGVSIFYMLSGLTLFYVYKDKLTVSFDSLKSFFIKRAARILPLLSLVTIIAIVLYRKVPNFVDVFLNVTGLFGFIKWDTYFAVGAWSIGNELVFYAFFPLLLFSSRKSVLFWISGGIILGSSIYFSYFELPKLNGSDLFWRNYINPLNQLLYFYIGIAIGKIFGFTRVVNNALLGVILILAIATFAFYPTVLDQNSLVMQANKYVFTVCCAAIVSCLFLMRTSIDHFYHKPLLFLGEVSYGLYLFHPIVYSIIKGILKAFKIPLTGIPLMILCAIISIFISYISYEYFEKKVAKFINRTTNK